MNESRVKDRSHIRDTGESVTRIEGVREGNMRGYL